MAIYKLKQKFLSLAEKFEIKDEQGEPVYIINGKFFSIGKQFTLVNMKGDVIAEIKQKVLSFRPTFYIQIAGQNKAKIVKTFLPLFRSRFLIEQTMVDNQVKQIVATGNFLSHEYEFNEQHTLIAKVSKQWFALSDTYGLDVLDSELTELIISALIVIDAVHHGGDND